MKQEIEQCKATPSEQLEKEIMDSRIPKKEREWWAKRRIEKLLAHVEELERLHNLCKEKLHSWQSINDEQNRRIAQLEASER